MDQHFVPRSHRQRAFGRTTQPALEISSGDVVTFETTDEAYERLWKGESPDEIPDDDYNIVTGPVVVHTAEPGDALKIEIVNIHIRRAWGVWIPGYGPLGDLTDELQVRPLEFANGQIAISDRLKVPLSPMIGCVGLAPDTGMASTLEPAYHFGGNLDLPELRVGTTLLLPVQTSGAWLSIGDLHAAMGTGEPTHISLEAAGEVTVRVTVEKNLRLFAPRLVQEGKTLCLSVLNEQGTIEQAAQLATRQAFDLLVNEFLLTPFEAYAYVSANVELRLGGPASAIVIAVVPHPVISSQD
jgi:amidase